MKNYVGYFESDGSYNERYFEKRKPQPERLNLWFDRPIAEQLQGRIFPEDGMLLDEMVVAMKFLCKNGALPDSRGRAVERQICLKAERCIAKFRKHTLPV